MQRGTPPLKDEASLAVLGNQIRIFPSSESEQIPEMACRGCGGIVRRLLSNEALADISRLLAQGIFASFCGRSEQTDERGSKNRRGWQLGGTSENPENIWVVTTHIYRCAIGRK